MWVKYGTEQKGTGKRTCKKTEPSACEMAKQKDPVSYRLFGTTNSS
ncbi:hypothetical protein FAEPRAM212_02849 [Faecalibacterium prausnitzii M21/2]|uniref:Uncharacterized protein n=1 Tax=Faecalibacterium prausnitzii M21/2 TaxID=411485 RepID=A8SFT9_9FIRM|nr:hypothetical protein FAEPRAM212_02849 [Faecalibacterium prausnitzii M21/2]